MSRTGLTQADAVERIAPELADGFRRARPLARAAVATKLAEALWREDVGDARARFRGRVHGFDRVVLEPLDADPLSLVEHAGLRAELASAVTGLALAYARRWLAEPALKASGSADMLALLDGQCPDLAGVRLEQLATEGHNLHPCGRTRLGWDVADMLRHDLETPSTHVAFVRVPAGQLIGDDVGARIGASGLPVHAWQLAHLRRTRPELRLDVEHEVTAHPTAALRTLLVAPGVYLKLSLDIQVTSTRRTISVAATHNGPVLSRLLAGLLDDDRVLLLPEPAGAASPAGDGRGLSVILRGGLHGRLTPGEVAVPGGALPAVDPLTGRTVLAGLVDRSGLGARGFLAEYARLLVPPVLRLAARHGIGLEAHLQNCVPTFVAGRPHRLALRDFAGLRLLPGVAPGLWPGSVIVTGDRREVLSKVAYTVFQAHLGELVLRLSQSHGLDETAAWRDMAGVVAQTLDGHPDLRFYTAPTVPHKALTRMRLGAGGDVYVPVRNPLHG